MKLDLHELVLKLIGPVTAVGDHRIDRDRLENLKVLTGLVEDLMHEVSLAAQTVDRPEASMQTIGKYAKDFLDSTQEDLKGAAFDS